MVKKYNKIALIGMMGTGKSYIGKALANSLNYQHYDLDQYISKKEKMSISNIFIQYGELYFRDLEEKTIKHLIAQPENLVLSCGGGSFIKKTNRDLLLDKSIVFSLSATAATIYNRIKNDQTRPLLQKDNSVEKIQNIINERSKFYNQAHYNIDTNRYKKLSIIITEITNKIFTNIEA
jgi:shikimate kinase